MSTLTTRKPRVRLRSRSMRTRLLVFVTATLVLVCAAMALTTSFVQRAYLMGDLDGRVTNAAARSLGGAALDPDNEDDLGFLNENGHPAGTHPAPARRPSPSPRALVCCR